MKKERIFYLDFIRALAVILILITHYNAVLYFYYPSQMDKKIITYDICNIYIGDFAVALFLIISGAALMYIYESKLKVIQFYKKRFLGIFLMFWLAYMIAFFFQIVVFHGNFNNVPKKNFLLTLFSIDAYYSGVMETFYLVGEWFLTCILIIYILFPILRWAVNKHPGYLIGAVILIYLLGIFCYKSPVESTQLVMVRLPEFLFGMLFIKYIKKVNWKFGVFGLAMLILNSIFVFDIDRNIRTTFIGIMAFLFLTYISRFLEFGWMKKMCGFLAKYSYAIFLVHHFIIYKITGNIGINMGAITKTESYGIFAVCVITSIVFGMMLYQLDKMVRKGISSLSGRLGKKQEETV